MGIFIDGCNKEIPTEQEIKDFLEEYGFTQADVKRLEGFKGGTDAVAEMCINFGYFWIATEKVWVNKNNSLYTAREEEIVEYLKMQN